MRILLKSFCILCSALAVASYPSQNTLRQAEAQTLLNIRGALSLRIAKGRLTFGIGEVANLGTSSTPSGQLELALWLSRNPYDGTQAVSGTKLAACTFEGIIGGETIANASCRARLKLLSRGKYYVIIILSELDQATDTLLIRDTFTFSKRLKF